MDGVIVTVGVSISVSLIFEISEMGYHGGETPQVERDSIMKL